MKIWEIRLQNGIFVYKAGISFTKWDFHLQRETLGLQTGLSLYISPTLIWNSMGVVNFSFLMYEILDIKKEIWYISSVAWKVSHIFIQGKERIKWLKSDL